MLHLLKPWQAPRLIRFRLLLSFRGFFSGISQRFSRRHVKWCPLPKILKLYFFLSVCKCQFLGILSIWSFTYNIGQYQGNGGGREIFLFKYYWFMWHVGVGGGQGSFFSQLKCIDCTPKCRMHTMANEIKLGKTACSLFTSRIHPFAPIYSTILYNMTKNTHTTIFQF